MDISVPSFARCSVGDTLAAVPSRQLVFAAFLMRAGERVTVNGKRVYRRRMRSELAWRSRGMGADYCDLLASR